MTYLIKEDRDHKQWPWQREDDYGFEIENTMSGNTDYVLISPPRGRAWDVPTMRETIYRKVFTKSYDGYPSLFISDGYALCYECGIKSLVADEDPRLVHYVEWSYADQLAGMTCDNCDQYIYEPHCGNCHRDESETLERCKGLLYNNSGDRCMCRECIAEGLDRSNHIGDKKLLPGRIFAERLAPDVYKVTNTCYDGIYGDGQAVCDYIRAQPRAW